METIAMTASPYQRRGVVRYLDKMSLRHALAMADLDLDPERGDLDEEVEPGPAKFCLLPSEYTGGLRRDFTPEELILWRTRCVHRRLDARQAARDQRTMFYAKMAAL